MLSLTIPRRFNGPPDSGHGGYSAGLAGTRLDGPAEVTLRAPPPLDQPLALEPREDGSVALSRDGTAVLEARPTVLALEPPEAVTIEEARAGSARCPWLDWHPFPTCFGCGHRREHADGLELYTGPVPGRGLHAAPWTPAAEFADGDGNVEPLWLWAALDCPSAAPVANDPGERRPVVLATLAAELLAPVRSGEPHAIGSWEVAREGRKRTSGVALWDAGGSLLALGRALWIELR